MHICCSRLKLLWAIVIFLFFTAVICKRKAVKSIQVIICVNVPVSIIQSASFTVEYSDSHGVHSAKGELYKNKFDISPNYASTLSRWKNVNTFIWLNIHSSLPAWSHVHVILESLSYQYTCCQIESSHKYSFWLKKYFSPTLLKPVAKLRLPDLSNMFIALF